MLVNRVLKIAVVCLPAVLTTAIIYGRLGTSLGQYVPNYSNDEVDYYREALTFQTAGFQGGYYTINELQAPASWDRFGPHGPAFPMLYGGIGWLVGTAAPQLGITLNVLFFSLALAFFIYVIKPDRIQLLMLCAILVTYYSALFHWISYMEESLNQAIALCMAAAVFWVQKQPPPLSRVRMGAIFLALVYASILRYTWSIFFLVFLWLWLKPKRPLHVAGIFLLSVCLVIASLLASHFWASPYPWNNAGALIASPSAKTFQMIVGANLRNNFRLLTDGRQMEQVELIQCILLVALLIGWMVKEWYKTRTVPSIVIVHGLNLIPIVTLGWFLYPLHIYAGYRNLAIHSFLALLLLVAFRQYRWVVAGAVVLSLLAFGDFVKELDYLGQQRFFASSQKLEAFRQSIDGVIVYDPQATNGWCNTVLYSNRLIHAYYATAFPPKIGVSRFEAEITLERRNFSDTDMHLALPLKSKFVLLIPRDYSTYKNVFHLQRIKQTPLGWLSYNTDSGCPIDPSLLAAP